MAEAVDNDVVEQVLIQLGAKDLNRYKRVCKSWHSLITSPRFVSRHLNRSYNKDRYNNQLGHRKVNLLRIPAITRYYYLKLIGSSNGLVCIFNDSRCKLIVGNPLTRELRQLNYSCLIGNPSCWGFGYDLSNDDYKVIVGGWKEGRNQTCFWILSLKSNVWRCIGDKKCRFLYAQTGILCNGALHWITINLDEKKKSIISYDLSKEEFKEISLPNARHIQGKLGILKECLCIFGDYCDDSVWVMKEYNVKESWEKVKISHDRVMKCDIVHWLRLGLSKDGDASWFYRASEHLCWEYMDAPVYVESLVSPHQGVPRTKCPRLMPLKRIPHVVKIKSEAVEEVKIEKSESDHKHVQEVAKESEID